MNGGNEKNKLSIIFSGVGGQGLLLASKLLGQALLEVGENVVMSEIHGMAQRGGMVTTTLRAGDVHSCLVATHNADVVLGFEPVETYRVLEYTSSETTIITNSQPIVPFTVSVGREEYPPLDTLLSAIEECAGERFFALEAERLAKSAGDRITLNIVMLGALAAVDALPISAKHLGAVVDANVPEHAREMNRKAFRLGYDTTHQLLAQKG